MEPSLLVIGVSARTAPVGIRERFSMDERGRQRALRQLTRAEGVNEAVVLASCERTEFILWAQDAPAAANEVLNFLTREYGLRSSEWKHFYRLVEERALLHLMRVAAGMDSTPAGDPQILDHLKAAAAEAQMACACGPVLQDALEHAMTAGECVRRETGLGAIAMTVPFAAVELARQIFGTLEKRRVVLIGAGQMANEVAHRLGECGVPSVLVLNRTEERAARLAATFGLRAAPMRERAQHLAEADIVINAVPASEFAITLPEIEAAGGNRNGRPLLLIDIGVPRNIDPAARNVPGIFLHDLDDVHEAIKRTVGDRPARTAQAEALIASEARQFCSKLESQRIVPTIVALRQKLDEIFAEELQLFRRESGALAEDPALEALAGRLSQALAGVLARELRERPNRDEQERLTEALQRLFRLESETAAAGAR